MTALDVETQDPGTPAAHPGSSQAGHGPDTLDGAGEAVATHVAMGIDVTTRRELRPGGGRGNLNNDE